MANEQASRREVLRKAAYVTPVILTLKVIPSFASSTSDRAEQARKSEEKDKEKGNNGVGNGLDPQPSGEPKINDGPGTSPGNPGNKQ